MKVLGTFNAYSVLSQSLFSDSDSNNSQQPQEKEHNNHPHQMPQFDTFCTSENRFTHESKMIETKTQPASTPSFITVKTNQHEKILDHLKELFKIALKLVEKKHYSSAISNFQTIQAIAHIHKLHKPELKALETIAKIYDAQNKLNLSLSYYYKAFNCADRLFNTSKKAELANNIASIHADLKQYKTSLKWFKQALFFAYLNNDNEAIDIILSSIFTTMQELNYLNKTVA